MNTRVDVEPEVLNVFVPLAKVDVAKRLVYGTMAIEAPDRSGEIMDYESGRPAIQAWSDDCFKASGGKSYGNVREMHGKVAAGILTTAPAFDDNLKKVSVCAYVEDDSTWAKVQKGVLTGFSIGGGYARRWTDSANKMLKRYTPRLSELSLVDAPCMPGATIEMVKADGAVETIEWGQRGFEPTNDDVKALAAEMAKAAGKPDKPNDFVVMARADLIKRHADAPAVVVDDPAADLEKALAEADALIKKDAKKPYGDVEYADPTDGKYPIDTAAHIRAAWSYVNMAKNASKLADPDGVKGRIVAAWKSKIDKGGPPSAEKMVFIGDMLKTGLAAGLLKAMGAVSLEKGFYTIGRTAHLLDRMSEIAQGVIWEEAYEEDGNSKLPQGIFDLMGATRTFLIEMVNEETAEFFAQAEKDGGDAIALLAPGCLDVDGMEMAAPLGDLKKLHAADVDLMEKVGAKISGANMKHVQSMHDHSTAMGAKCDSGNCQKTAGAEDLAKVDPVAELARARRVMAASVPAIQDLTKRAKEADETMAKMTADHNAAIEALKAQIETIGKGPGLAKGVVYSVSKEADDAGRQTQKTAPAADMDPADMDASQRRQWALRKIADKTGQPVGTLAGPGY